MRRYRAYLFDLYGTLVDIHTDEEQPALWRAMAECFGREGAKYAPKELRGSYIRFCADAEAAAAKEASADACVEIDLYDVFSRLYSEKGVRPDKALIESTASLFRHMSTTHIRAYAGAEDLLSALRDQGSLVILLSNAQRLFTLQELDRLGLTDLFNAIYISSDFGYKKPDRRFFEAPLKQLDLEPSDCLMIGNDPVCDIWGARNAGMDSVYIRSALSPVPEPDLPDRTLCLNHMDLRRLRKLLTNIDCQRRQI